ncbi:Ger(x)C family spore germination protein [Cytobacillus firmus]|uniref:Ger(x)C family spore germination protein n=1 Tax=Cytobacillus firmus TaxID=1399 RepID=UPI002494A1DE|nr:Ger(x)C family spore germination protein [Cytobacillus firmus]
MKKILLMIMIIGLVSGLTGCWGKKEIQSQIYITGIGIDFAEDEFTVYLQAMNFASIAKQEGASSLQESVPNFIGEAKGKTIQSAISKFEQKAAYPLYFGHVETILLSENTIKEQVKSVVEYIGQDHFLRYNSNFFGTNQPIKEIFTSDSFFNYPSLYTILHNPDPLTESNFIIPVQKYNKFISTYYEPIGSFIVPGLKINQSHFSEGEEKKQISAIMGGFVISNQEYKGWVAKDDLSGIKWTSNQAITVPLSLFDEKVSVLIIKPERIVKVLEGNRPTYKLNVRGRAELVQNEDNISIDQIEEAINKKVKSDIQKSLEVGDEMNADLLNISETAYRYHLKTWKPSEIKSFDLNSVENIDVNIRVEKSVNYKR